MRPEDAAGLAERLCAAFPDSGASTRTASIFAERLVRLDPEIARRATERLIDTSRRFPTVADLFEAYAAEGGGLGDPGRAMSPPVGPLPDPPTPGEAVQIAELQARARKTLAMLRPDENPGYGPDPDDQGGQS